MKYIYFLRIAGCLIGMVTLFASCGDGPVYSSYRPVLAQVPAHWEEMLGEAHWRLEWIDERGAWRENEIEPPCKAPMISIPSEWTTPILAWPYWPEHGLDPGMMRPSGALFPWDASGRAIALSWNGGVDAVFWKEMAGVDHSQNQNRRPWYFDWPRFRELFASENIALAVREDPWLADWKDISQKTVQSGFDRRRIVSQKFTEIVIPGFGGRWIASSPFAPPLDADGDLTLNAPEAPETWVHADGILRCSSSGWVWRAHHR